MQSKEKENIKSLRFVRFKLQRTTTLQEAIIIHMLSLLLLLLLLLLMYRTTLQEAIIIHTSCRNARTLYDIPVTHGVMLHSFPQGAV